MNRIDTKRQTRVRALGINALLTVSLALAGVFEGAEASSADQIRMKLKSDIRVSAVKNTCRGYQQSFAKAFVTNETNPTIPGEEPQQLRREEKEFMYDAIVNSSTTEDAREFLQGIADELMRTRSSDRAQRIINDPRTFLQPCYNIVAKQYDKRQRERGRDIGAKPVVNWGSPSDAVTGKEKASSQQSVSTQPGGVPKQSSTHNTEPQSDQRGTEPMGSIGSRR
ncbi:MAG: hypothetical protein AWU57_325 [Marinobacter sp. T13-3]|nr:MAG: hypothetical protein AWU57_325 [Marinobacter sp. T13-3]